MADHMIRCNDCGKRCVKDEKYRVSEPVNGLDGNTGTEDSYYLCASCHRDFMEGFEGPAWEEQDRSNAETGEELYRMENPGDE